MNTLIDINPDNLTDAKVVIAQLLGKVQELEEQVVIDPMTSLHNRRGMDRLVTDIWTNGDRYATNDSAAAETGVTIMVIDIDHFKRYNDTHGHLEGDVLIKSIASLMKPLFKRSKDLLVRYGGEEFVGILCGTSVDHSIAVANELMEAVKQTVKVTPPGADAVTVSVGGMFAPFSSLPDSQTFIGHSDKNLYQAKASGRNRLVFSQYPLQ